MQEISKVMGQGLMEATSGRLDLLCVPVVWAMAMSQALG